MGGWRVLRGILGLGWVFYLWYERVRSLWTMKEWIFLVNECFLIILMNLIRQINDRIHMALSLFCNIICHSFHSLVMIFYIKAIINIFLLLLLIIFIFIAIYFDFKFQRIPLTLVSIFTFKYLHYYYYN